MTNVIDGTTGARADRRTRVRTTPRTGRTAWRDVAESLGGVAVMAAAVVTPFDRPRRNRWGIGPDARSVYPGDDLVEEPRWEWTHGIEVDAPADQVWPWLAQIGADRGGFYSYQWLENLARCRLRNADAIHTDWAVSAGDELSLHPKVPPLRVVGLAAGRWFVAYGEPSLDAIARGEPWTAVSWLFLVEELDAERCRVVSRYRCATSDDRVTRLQFGPTLIEPIGFAMDRRMLLGVKERAERASGHRTGRADRRSRLAGLRSGWLGRRSGRVGSRTGDQLIAARGLPAPVRRDWGELATPTVDPRRFDTADVDVLPPPVARWLRHAITPGAPLLRSAQLTMHGEIRVGRWLPFSAVQVLAPPRGSVWAASAGRRLLRFRGFDRYSRGEGQMRWKVLGAIPVMSAHDDDVTRSAAGRLAGESILVPAAALDPAVTWRAVDDNHATADVRVGGLVHRVTVEVDDDGALRSVWLPRWGDAGGGAYAEQPFGVELDGEATFDGYTIPTRLRAGWGYGTDGWDDGVFVRATIDRADYR
jgi:hypothetical protein